MQTENEILKREISVLNHKNELQKLNHNQEVLNLKSVELKLQGEINELEISLVELRFQHKRIMSNQVNELK